MKKTEVLQVASTCLRMGITWYKTCVLPAGPGGKAKLLGLRGVREQQFSRPDEHTEAVSSRAATDLLRCRVMFQVTDFPENVPNSRTLENSIVLFFSLFFAIHRLFLLSFITSSQQLKKIVTDNCRLSGSYFFNYNFELKLEFRHKNYYPVHIRRNLRIVVKENTVILGFTD